MANNSLELIEKEIKQYIVVMVGSEQYGIDIRYIDNIVRMQKITGFRRRSIILRVS